MTYKYKLLAVHPPAYGARLLLALAALDSRVCGARSIAPAAR